MSAAIHGVNPHYQVTMDTYASSAGDPSSFYNIRALAPAVDGFFVMEYQLNLQSGGSAESPLTSTMFSDRTAVDQYLAAVPASKVLLGLPYFGRRRGRPLILEIRAVSDHGLQEGGENLRDQTDRRDRGRSDHALPDDRPSPEYQAGGGTVRRAPRRGL